MTDNNTIYQVDSFTDSVFKGNPAGVMLVDETITEDWMQQMAMEMNLSETAYVKPLDEEDHYHIRFFTPTTEATLCGHATLASSHIMFETGAVNPETEIRFTSKGGELLVKRDSDWLSMNFPRHSFRQIDIPSVFQSIIGIEPIEFYEGQNGWKIAVAADAASMRKASPNFTAMVDNDLGYIVATAKSDVPEADFIVRCFVPGAGINEDPVTGSVHCVLTPMWAEKLGKETLRSMQVSKRTGLLELELKNDRVHIKGKAKTVFKAQLHS